MIRNYKQRCPAWLFLPMLVLLSTHAVQAEPGLYDVEVIIFSNDTAGSDDEHMTRADSDAPPVQAAFPASEFTELSSAAYRLNNIRGGLSAARGYRVLFHRAWRQPAYDRSRALDYPVYTAESGRDSVEGTITLVKERYLHLDVNLRLMKAHGGTPAPDADGPGNRPAFRLTEKRRIRSSEVHYFDHPRFGVIALVTPYEAPEPAASPEPAMQDVPEDAAAGGQEEEPVPADDQLTR